MAEGKLSVDILKAVCAVWVILLHTIYGNWYDKLGMVFWAQMAVPIFMMLSGYTYTSSIRKKEIVGPIQWFSFDNMAPKIRRILIPYSMMFIAEVILQSLTKSAKMNSIFAFLTGGWGPGAYYIPLLFQLLLIFPILYRTYQRNAMEGFCKVFALSVAVEYIFSVMSLSDLLYSRCISRYIVMIYLGIVLYEKGTIILKTLLPQMMFILGATFVFFAGWLYKDYSAKLFNTDWFVTTAPSALYVFPIVLWFIQYEPWFQNRKLAVWCAALGRASFHIYLVQKAYFAFVYTQVLEILNQYLPNNLLSACIELIVNMAICVIGGVIFWMISRKIEQCFSQKISNR